MSPNPNRIRRSRLPVGHIVRLASAAGITLALVAGVAHGSTTAAPPTNTSPPTISGTPQEGQKLVGNRGSWNGSPSDYNDFWVRCDKVGGAAPTSSAPTTHRLRPPNSRRRQHDPPQSQGEERRRQHIVILRPDRGGNRCQPHHHRDDLAADGHRHPERGPEARRSQRRLERQPDRLQRLLGALRQERRQLRQHQRRHRPQRLHAQEPDVGNTIRFKVEAKNAGGNTFASSVPTAVITRPAAQPAARLERLRQDGRHRPGRRRFPPARLIDRPDPDQPQHHPLQHPLDHRPLPRHRLRRHRPRRPRLRHRRPLRPVLDPQRAAHRRRRLGDPPVLRRRRLPRQQQTTTPRHVRPRPQGGENLLAGISTRRLVSFHVTAR